MFHWFSSNKDWLQHARLGRMMKRLLRRAASLNPADLDDDKSDDSVATGAAPEMEAKMQLMSNQLAAAEQALNQTRQQVLVLQTERMQAVTKQELQSLSQQVHNLRLFRKSLRCYELNCVIKYFINVQVPEIFHQHQTLQFDGTKC